MNVQDVVRFSRSQPNYATGFIPVERGFCTTCTPRSDATWVVQGPEDHRGEPGGERWFAWLKASLLCLLVINIINIAEFALAQDGATNGAASLTLEQLRAKGVLRSRYRQQRESVCSVAEDPSKDILASLQAASGTRAGGNLRAMAWAGSRCETSSPGFPLLNAAILAGNGGKQHNPPVFCGGVKVVADGMIRLTGTEQS